MKYINAISIGEKTFEEEVLTENERYNEYVMTHLRTMWGISSKELKEKFPNNYFEHFTIDSEKWIASEDLKNNADVFILTEKGKLIADRIASDLFVV